MNKVKISIGIVSFARPKSLGLVLQKIMEQIRDEIEVVVVLDGKDDESASILESFKGKQFRFFIHEKNQGRPRARNRVLLEALGEYILWIDDDDLPLPGLLDRHLEVINAKPEIDVVYTNLEQFDDRKGEFLDDLDAPDISGYKSKFLERLIRANGLPSIGSLIRRSLYFEVGGFDERFVMAQDFEFWFRIAQKARFYKIDEKLYRYNRHNGGITFQKRFDYSFITFAVLNALQRIPLEELYPCLNWKDTERALSQALMKIAFAFLSFGDAYNAVRFFRKVRIDYMTTEYFSAYIHALLLLGRTQEIKGVFGSIKRSVIHFDLRDIFHLDILVQEALEMEEKIIIGNNAQERKSNLRAYKQKFQYLSLRIQEMYSSKFEKVGNRYHQRLCDEICLRYEPQSVHIRERVLSSCYAEAAGEVDAMIMRMLGNETDKPLYYLKSLNSPGRGIIRSDASLFPYGLMIKD